MVKIRTTIWRKMKLQWHGWRFYFPIITEKIHKKKKNTFQIVEFRGFPLDFWGMVWCGSVYEKIHLS